MNGKIAAFRISLFSVSVSITVDFIYYQAYLCVYFLVWHYFRSTVHKQDIRSVAIEPVFQVSVAFPYPAFEKVSFYCPSEKFFGDGDHNPVVSASRSFDEPAANHFRIGGFTFCKKY